LNIEISNNAVQVGMLSMLDIAFKVYHKMSEQLRGNAQYLDLAAMTSLVAPPSNFMGLGTGVVRDAISICGLVELQT
jgi:hypothetical protein